MMDDLLHTRSSFPVSLHLVVVLIGLVAVGTGAGTNACRAQSTARLDAGRSLLSASDETERPSVGRILGGSAIGGTVGGGIGYLLLKAGAEADPNDDRDLGEDPESEAATAIMGVGLVAVVMGGPIGAVEIGGIEHRRRDAYVAAGFGEAVAGMLGLALAGQIHDSSTARLVGLGSGMVLGAAGGAYLVAVQETQDGFLSYQDRRWQVAPPDVQVRPNLMTDRSPSVGVALVSAEF
jgi:hypothetical protein